MGPLCAAWVLSSAAAAVLVLWRSVSPIDNQLSRKMPGHWKIHQAMQVSPLFASDRISLEERGVQMTALRWSEFREVFSN